MPMYGWMGWRDYTLGDIVYGIASTRGEYQIEWNIDDANVWLIDDYALAMGEVGQGENAPTLYYDKNFMNWLTMTGKGDIVGTDLNTIASNRLYNQTAARKCKGGLDYITKYTDQHIHFLLDGLDMFEVATKSHWLDEGGKLPWNHPQKGRSITSAELRWCFRHRNERKVYEKVQFWYNLAQVDPPWTSTPVGLDWVREWNLYIPSDPQYQ